MIKELILLRMKAFFCSVSASLQRKKAGKKSGIGSIVLLVLLFAYLGFAFMALFYSVFGALAQPFREAGLGWLYFTLYGLVCFGLMFIGTVFMTKAQLFEAKDNELLLALPIRPMDILISRTAFLLLSNLVMELVVAIPAMIAWLSCGGMSAGSVLAFMLLALLMPFLALAVTCLFAWLISLLTSRIRNKSLLTVVFSLAFLLAYFLVIGRMNTYVMELAANGAQLAGRLISVAPLYWFGTAIADGSGKGLLLSVLLIAAAFAVVWGILSRNFVKIATATHGFAKIEYKETEMKTASPSKALLRREIARLFAYSDYLLNAGLGSLLCLVAAVVLFAAKAKFTAAIAALSIDAELFSGLIAAAMGFLASTFLFTASSVSLEGKTLWILRSVPVESTQILESKLLFHYIFSLIPAAIVSIACVMVLHVSFWVIPFAVLFASLMGSLGLTEDLRHINLNWTQPAQASKQGLGVVCTMFIGWGIVVTFGCLYGIALRSVLSMDLYLMLCCVVLELTDRLLIRWLMHKGVQRLETFD